jgi:hypothetical protein
MQACFLFTLVVQQSLYEVVAHNEVKDDASGFASVFGVDQWDKRNPARPFRD